MSNKELREQLTAIPHGAHSAGEHGWNRYDTDTHHVLHLWAGGVSYDITTPKRTEGCGCVRWGLLVQKCEEHRHTDERRRRAGLRAGVERLVRSWDAGNDEFGTEDRERNRTDALRALLDTATEETP